MAQMITSGQVRLLLEAVHQRQVRHTASWTVGIGVLGLLNLFVCAYLERFVGTDNTPDGFMFFLAAESFFVLLTGAAVVTGELDIIAQRIRLFPLTPTLRYDLVFVSLLRHRAMLVISGTALFAAALLGPANPALAATRVGMTGLLLLSLYAVMSTLTIFRGRRGNARRSLGALIGLITVFLLVVTAVASPGPILQIVVPLRWTVAGIVAAQESGMVASLEYAAYLILITGVCAWVGRRYA
jgi:hypothetical protein